MTSKLASHLMKSRHGVYYLRIAHGGKEKRRSLRTKDAQEAKLAAFSFGYKLAHMKKEEAARFALLDEIFEEEKFQAGVKNYEAQQRAYARLEAIKDQNKEEAYFQLLLQQNPHIKQPPQQQPDPVIAPSITIEDACDQYLAARKKQITEGTYRTWKSCLNKLKHALAGREINTIVNQRPKLSTFSLC